MSLLALAPDGQIRQPLISGETGQCTYCDTPMIGHHGPIRIHHWAHRPNNDCDPWTEPESDWHLDWKRHARLTGFDVEQTIKRGDTTHRADIVTADGLVIELQHNYLDAVQIQQREAFYGRMIWVYDAAEWLDSGRLHWGRQLSETRHGFWFKNGGASLALHRRPIYFHVGINEHTPSMMHMRFNRITRGDGSRRLLGVATDAGATRTDFFDDITPAPQQGSLFIQETK